MKSLRNSPSRPLPWILAAATGLLLLAGCDPAPQGQSAEIRSRDSIAPPEPGEGAVGFVDADNAGAAENPITPALPGGPEGQTPGKQRPGSTPSVVRSDPMTPASDASSTKPLENLAHDEEPLAQ